ncbi:DNA helicase/exodeoxyribonuclease V subunit A [Roseiarcus fermentans]|uniref:DNA 3'-5' helicase n=1 Tax=Roseiarcus fermentans TaxID=1473586 RepID=A0A366EUT9_9HYPH|nr:double-strand break repair helicase AddA [Roseiarcus fermentans]RBP05696.1 DNA helicase/exodeoxyribonuclease V subunit A [Roseiarcus fermentans]
MSRPLDIPEALRRYQALASDPAASAWVSANAGSGKTHVLTQRVLRLLLDGAKPAQILGLTFTKAAAANMAGRIFRTLAEWTTLDDERLSAAIAETGAGRPGPPALAFARQLFARTIETPGGLKIQTLHAFCERLLQVFPFEANVPAHFKVVDEREAARLMIAARDRALVALGSSAEGEAALDRVARDAGAFNFDRLLAEAQDFAEVFAGFADAARYGEALRRRLGLQPGETTASVETEMLGGDVGTRRRIAWAQGLAAGKAQDKAFAAGLTAANAGIDRTARVRALLGAFFTKDGEGEPRGGKKAHLTTAAVRETRPDLEKAVQRELVRLIGLRDRLRSVATLDRSTALFAVSGEILTAFAAEKAGRGALDFADQIARALALVTRSSAAWVMQKLDYGLDHLLIDEAQDNSAGQWRIVEALTDEFFAGESARSRRRTVFAVGDEKQSIFSFQGAAPGLFADMRRGFARRHRDADKPFASVPMNFSFRSAPAVLAAVDMVFQSEAAWNGVAAEGEPPPIHEAIQKTLKGVVEIWPPVEPETGRDPDDWRMPLDEPAARDPAVVLAQRIASQIARWLDPGSRERVVGDDGEPRRIRPGDVLILVRRRNAFFEAMIRALKDRGVKVAGADRLKLREHIAVMDLIAAGRAALAADDDLSLACALKSPLIGLDDPALYRLAADRAGPLAAALDAAQDPAAQAAARRVAEWRRRAVTLGPYAFYARLVGEDGGRKALIARLGDDAADPIDEFLALALDHERNDAPSLTRFLAEVEETEAEIKRDLEAESDGVRVLTVHASKGLEAPIVILPDTMVAPGGRHDPKLMPLAPLDAGDPPLFAWTRKAAEDCDVVAAARARGRAEEAGEHRRLLYVAMTRAAERLIVAGYQGQRRRPDGCWYDLVAGSLEPATVAAPAFWDAKAIVRRYGESLTADAASETEAPAAPPPPPGWLSTRIADAAPALRIRPSARAAGERAGRRAEGLVAHALLHLLPGVERDRRREAALSILGAQGAGLPEARRRALLDQVLAVIDAPELAPLFGPNSRAEVPFAGAVDRPGGPPLPLSGRLDRLAVTDDAVYVVDFKLGAAPAAPAPAHVAQLALTGAALEPLYPGRAVRAALVYLDGPAIRPLSKAELKAALAPVITS